MIPIFKHTYIKYLLLMMLSLKAGFFVIENISSIEEIEICCELDFDDIEDEKELDEKEKIVQEYSFFNLKRRKKTENHPIFSSKYRIQYLEFSTPPPEFLA